MTSLRSGHLPVMLMALLAAHASSLASEPSPGAGETRSAAERPAAAVPATLRVEVNGSRLRILRAELAGEVPLSALTLPAPARDAPLRVGRAAYVVLEAQGVLVIDIGVPTDPYIVWHLAKDAIVLSLSLWQDRLDLETPQEPISYDVSEPLRPQGKDITQVAPRRFYGAASPTFAAPLQTTFPPEAPTGRRLVLQSGERLICRLSSPQPGLLDCDGRRLRSEEIQRIDAVYADETAPKNVAPPAQSRPGHTSAIRRQAEGTPLADAWTLSALSDGSSDRLLYRARGTRLEILRRHGSDEILLGIAALPAPARSQVLQVGPAAVILLQQGAAVVDVTLARFPYVAWILEPSIEIELMRIQHGELVLMKRLWQARYNLALPLLPSGANRHPVEWCRATDSSATAADAAWIDRPDAAGQRARRLFLRGLPPQLVWDFRCSAETSRCRWRVGQTEDSAAAGDIEHVEAVLAPPGATSVAATVAATVPRAASPAPPAAGPPTYSWQQVAAPSGPRLVRHPARTAGIVLAIAGGGMAIAGGASALIYGMGFPYVGRIGSDELILGCGIVGGVGLVVGIVGGGVALAAPDTLVQVPR